MGAALDVDWSSLRAAAVALRNVRAAARHACAHLPKDEQQRFLEAVTKRATREGWMVKAAAAVHTLSKEDKLTSGTMSEPVLNGHQLLQALEPDSRLKLAVAGNNAVTHLSKLSPAKIAGQTQPLLNAGKVLSVAHRWGEPTQAGQVMVNVNLLGVELPIVEQIQSNPVAITDLANIVEQANPQV